MPPEAVKESEVVEETTPVEDSLTDDAAGILKDLGYDVDEPEETEEVQEESEEDDPEETEEVESEEESEEEEAEEEPETIDDKWEITHDGKQIELTKDDVVKYAQMGFDYTKKTQALASDRKAFEQEVETAKTELESFVKEQEDRFQAVNEDLVLKQNWDSYIDSLKESEPDVYDILTEGFAAHMKQVDNPLIRAQMSKLQQRLDEVESSSKSRENELIQYKFEQEYKSLLSDIGERAEKLGLKVDKDKIRQAWIHNAHDAKTAFYMVHGEDLTKRAMSKGKIEGVKRAAKAKKPSPTRKQGTPKKSSQVDYGRKSDLQIADDLITGKIPMDF